MAVAYDTGTESAVSTSAASFSWSHTAAAGADAAVVFVLSIQGTSDATSVTYGGATMTFLFRGSDTDTEAGTVDAYFLDGIATGTQTVVVNRVNDATQMMGIAVTVTSSTDDILEVPTANIVTTGGSSTNTGASTSGTGTATNAEVAVNDGSPGTNSLRFSAQYTGAASPPAAGTNSTLVHDNDFTAFGWTVVRETTAGQGSRNVGSTSGSDDRAGVFLAVRERIPISVTPGIATLALTTFAPTVSAPRLVTPGAASLTTARFIPVVTATNNQLVRPGLATLTLTAFAPAVSAPRLVTPGTASLTTARFAPSVATPRLVTPGLATLALNPFAPTVTTTVGGGATVTPGTATLILTRFAPTVSAPRLATPGLASLILTTFAPSVTIASNDRILTAAWDQAAATWDALLDTPVVPSTEGPPHHGPRLGAATVQGPAGRRVRRMRLSATFIQRAASWQADLDVNDDELAMTFLLDVLSRRQ